METYLTRNSHLILVDREGEFFFADLEGEFLRSCTWQEVRDIQDRGQLILIQIDENSSLYLKLNSLRTTEWKFLWEVTHKDNSQFIAELSNNGGAYGFAVLQKFFARSNNGQKEYCCVEIHSTTSDFKYDQLTGHFQNFDMAEIEILGTNVPKFDVYTQCGSDSKGYLQDDPVYLDQIATMCPETVALLATNSYIDENGEYSQEKLFEAEIDQRKELVKKILGDE